MNSVVDSTSAKKLSVVICTSNRASSLQSTLKSLCLAKPPLIADWEVVVVLNNCTDRSEEVAFGFRGVLPIVLAIEPSPGLSNARNKAIAVASGDFILWTDDDVRVDPQWMIAYEAAIQSHPNVSFFGGPIIPEFGFHIPTWLERALQPVETAFATRRVPPDAGTILPTSSELPFGANFATRYDEQKRFRYDLRLGRGSTTGWVIGEETDVLRQILVNGGTGRWVSEARIVHVVPPERQTVRYIRSFYRTYGQVVGVGLAPPDRPDHNLLFELSLALWWEIRHWYWRMLCRPEKWVPLMKESAIAWGRVAGRCRSLPPQ